MIDPVYISMLRKELPNTIAMELCGVQPMTGALDQMLLNAKTEKELIEEGYEPISEDTRIIWRKKE